ncbi:MAG: UDP-N-acetylmuramoyl-L-alanyl-D-glutamate--2,6-diaminopimelate ligase [Proteobacteria bacterium]|nr:UDP-N-acetylmuramoyl-L-alanyl-D-glutamate--2,6-diaminopimelate ligase [Pseudomonadota bacterium]MBU1717337.1 UDP-N-acetylmuramoyl-L-alanyl-D-glutamate--2,6-diaminopimelate ligase [Pseudomonadota bacterium]
MTLIDDNSARVGQGMKLHELLKAAGIKRPLKSKNIEITSIVADSRLAGPGTVFVAVPGQKVDGHKFVADAIAKGCDAVVVMKGAKITVAGHVQRIVEDDCREALAKMAAAFNGFPQKNMKMIGITGTNGKTTTTYLLESVIKASGGNPGVIGTVNYRYLGHEIAAPFTTPEPAELFSLLRKMLDAGVTHVIMEVSSHALSQKRLYGLVFDVALFTNLSREHLDFHHDMEEYFKVKKSLFTNHLKKEGISVVVEDESFDRSGVEGWGRRLAKELMSPLKNQGSGTTESSLVTCGIEDGLVHVDRYQYDLQGVEAEVVYLGDRLHLRSSLVGKFNLKNVLGVTGVAFALGIKGTDIERGIVNLSKVPGRLERVMVGEGSDETAGTKFFVDYAHTPDALENVLSTLRKLTAGRIVVVFGCGGDRDKGKRPEMGEIAGRIADVVLITSDNPRSEVPERIMAEIERGICAGLSVGKAGNEMMRAGMRMRAEILLRRGWRGYDLIVSRREAISLAVRYAKPEDVVLISGKGHENYQITKSGRRFFDDRLELLNQTNLIGWKSTFKRYEYGAGKEFCI